MLAKAVGSSPAESTVLCGVWVEVGWSEERERRYVSQTTSDQWGTCVKPNANDNAPSRVKSNSLGNSRPLGIRTPSCRSSSKNVWTIASIAPSRMLGVYSSRCETRSIASGDVRGRKTCQTDKRICVSVESRSHATPDQTAMQTNLDEWVRLNLRKLVFHVVGIHRLDLVPRGRPQDLDNFHQLVDAALTRE